MSNAQTVGVVIPAFESARSLPSALESVLQQRGEERLEVIVVDDGSSDESAAIVERFMQRDPRVSLVRKAHGGAAAARNSGFAAVSAAVGAVLFLDADHELEPDAIARLAAALRSSGGAVHGTARRIDHAGRLGAVEPSARRELVGGRLVARPASAPTSFEMLTAATCVHGTGQVLISRALLERVGPFKVGLERLADWDLWLRVSLITPFAFVKEPVLRYRTRDGRVRRDVQVASRYARRTLTELSDEFPHDPSALVRAAHRVVRARFSSLRFRWSSAHLHLRPD